MDYFSRFVQQGFLSTSTQAEPIAHEVYQLKGPVRAPTNLHGKQILPNLSQDQLSPDDSIGAITVETKVKSTTEGTKRSIRNSDGVRKQSFIIGEGRDFPFYSNNALRVSKSLNRWVVNEGLNQLPTLTTNTSSTSNTRTEDPSVHRLETRVPSQQRLLPENGASCNQWTCNLTSAECPEDISNAVKVAGSQLAEKKQLHPIRNPVAAVGSPASSIPLCYWAYTTAGIQCVPKDRLTFKVKARSSPDVLVAFDMRQRRSRFVPTVTSRSVETLETNIPTSGPAGSSVPSYSSGNNLPIVAAHLPSTSTSATELQLSTKSFGSSSSSTGSSTAGPVAGVSNEVEVPAVAVTYQVPKEHCKRQYKHKPTGAIYCLPDNKRASSNKLPVVTRPLYLALHPAEDSEYLLWQAQVQRTSELRTPLGVFEPNYLEAVRTASARDE